MKKYINPNLTLLQNFRTNNSGLLSTGGSKKHLFNGLSSTIEFKENIVLKPNTFLHTDLKGTKDIKFRKGSELQLVCSAINYYISGNDIIPTKISFPNFEDPLVDAKSLRKEIIANVHNVSSQSKKHYNKERFYRYLLPIEKELTLQGDFYPLCSVCIDSQYTTLLKIEIENQEYHLYSIKTDDQFYIIIDAMDEIMFERFTQVVNSIFMVYAMLKGTFYGGFAYIFSYNNRHLKNPKSIRTFESSDTSFKGYEVHTTNPYKYLNFQSPRFKKNKEGNLERIGKDTARNYMVEFPLENYSKLCELIITRGSLLRSFILLTNCTNSPLEVKIPALFVVLENITKVIVTKDSKKDFEIFEEEDIKKSIKKISEDAAKGVSALERKNRPKGLTSDEIRKRKLDYERLITKLYKINKGSNNQKLSEPFEKFGYVLSKDEENALYVQRNKFIHGDDFSLSDVDFDKEFQDLFHLSFIVYNLCIILLLKLSGFSGYIVYLPKVYNYITNQKISGKALRKI